MSTKDKNWLEVLIKCGIKLEVNSETLCSACYYMHKFRRDFDANQYDMLVMCATALYLAAKVEENHLKIRDVINTFHSTIHKTEEPLECDNRYWTIRDSIVKCELLLLRMLRFRVSVLLPHRYLTCYLKTLCDWIADDNISNKLSVTCVAVLNDYYCMDERAITHMPNHIAIAVIKLSLQLIDYDIPYNDEAILSWNEAFDDSLTKDKMDQIVDQIISIYNDESQSSKSNESLDVKSYIPQFVYNYGRDSSKQRIKYEK
jgi:cyclin-Q